MSGIGLASAPGQALGDHWLVVNVPCRRCVGVVPVVWSGIDKRKGPPKGSISATSASAFASSLSSSSSSSSSSAHCSTGVHYQVHIRVAGKVFELGIFTSEEDAARAHDRALIRAIGPHELHAFWAMQVSVRLGLGLG